RATEPPKHGGKPVILEGSWPPLVPSLIEPVNIPTQTADWQLPGEAQQGLRRYVQTIRERWKLIALSVLVTTLAAALYVGTAQKTYKAEADLIITPIAGQDTT